METLFPPTRATKFGHIPVCEADLFEVRAGIDAMHALGNADSLDVAVHKLLTEAVVDNGMEPDIAWLCRFAMDAAQALRNAAGVTA